MSVAEKTWEIHQGRLTLLPPELHLSILRYAFEPDRPYLVYRGDYAPDWEPLLCLREQLKPTRLMNRMFHDAVTPIIFASIHLHASELSLQRAESIANSRLAHHVREIVHHDGTFANAQTDNAHFLSILKSHRRRQDYPKSLSAKKDGFDELYSSYKQEVTAGRDSSVFEIGRMTALVRKLPRCITFTTLPYERSWCDPVTSAYTLRRTGLSYLPNFTILGRITDPSFLSSMTQWCPRVLNLTNFPLPSSRRLLELLHENPIQEDQSQGPMNWAKELIYLRLSWPDFPVHVRQGEGQQVMQSRLFDHLFQSAHNLVHLEISNGFNLSHYKSTIPTDGLPKLKWLTVSQDHDEKRWVEQHLHDLIEHLGNNLKHLHFDNIELFTYNSPHSAASNEPGCLLRLLFNLTSCTKLESCTGLETVTDTKSKARPGQKFVTPGPKPGKAAILANVQEAVCGRRSWPEHFSMNHLPMDVPSQRLHPTSRITIEAAFISSAWEDTVDPWDVRRVLDNTSTELEMKQIDSPSRQAAISAPRVPNSSTGSTSRFSRISRILSGKRSNDANET